MIEYNFKRSLVFYDMKQLAFSDVKKRTKANSLSKDKFIFEDNITQKIYVKLILSHVEIVKNEIESREQRFIFQKNDDAGHERKSQKNVAREAKVRMNLNFIDD